jgi:hypothetical protein
VYVNALLANLNARSKLRGDSRDGTAIFIDSQQFRTPTIQSPSRKGDIEDRVNIQPPEVLTFSRKPIIDADINLLQRSAVNFSHQLTSLKGDAAKHYDSSDCGISE